MMCKRTSQMVNKLHLQGFLYVLVVSAFLIRPGIAMCAPHLSGHPFFLPEPDTIYQTDTVYQYEYVYDTIYYYDTVPETDTTFSESQTIEETDTVTIVKKTLDVVITQNRTVYLDKNNFPDFPERTFREMGDGKIPDVDVTDRKAKIKPPGISRTTRIKPDVKTQPPENIYIPLPKRKDTLYRFDTIINFKFRSDTVYFENRKRSDTVVTQRTTYEDFGRSVLVKETVNMKITKRKNVYQDKSEHGHSRKPKDFDSGRGSRKATKIVPSRYRSSFSYTPRGGKDHVFTGTLRLGFSWFKPTITYVSRNSEYDSEVNKMNQNHQGENSLAMSFTYLYFKERTGFEAGLRFSQHEFSCDHDFQKVVTDTTGYWEYFQKESFLYDTTWYLDLDHLLQTGDTLLIPNVDSTSVMITDSTHRIKVDSSLVTMTDKFQYTFSFLEIPLIAHYNLIDRKFYVNVSAGLIPAFLVSKTGRFSYPENETVVNAQEIDFDYGFMLSFYGSAVIGYKFDKRWSVFAEPYVRRNLFSVIQNNMVRVNINSWGLKAGIAYRLFKIQSK